jgi:hypothetical protein
VDALDDPPVVAIFVALVADVAAVAFATAVLPITVTICEAVAAVSTLPELPKRIPEKLFGTILFLVCTSFVTLPRPTAAGAAAVLQFRSVPDAV